MRQAPAPGFLGCRGGMLQRVGFRVEAAKGGAGGHQRRGGQCLLTKGCSLLSRFVQRHPQGRERGEIGKSRRGRATRGMLLLLCRWEVLGKDGGHGKKTPFS